MNTQKKKMGRPAKLSDNIAMAIEQEFYGLSYLDLARKYGLNPKTAWEKVQYGRRFINLEKIKEVMG